MKPPPQRDGENREHRGVRELVVVARRRPDDGTGGRLAGGARLAREVEDDRHHHERGQEAQELPQRGGVSVNVKVKVGAAALRIGRAFISGARSSAVHFGRSLSRSLRAADPPGGGRRGGAHAGSVVGGGRVGNGRASGTDGERPVLRLPSSVLRHGERPSTQRAERSPWAVAEDGRRKTEDGRRKTEGGRRGRMHVDHVERHIVRGMGRQHDPFPRRCGGTDDSIPSRRRPTCPTCLLHDLHVNRRGRWHLVTQRCDTKYVHGIAA